jgi:hypothetical protein
MFHNLFSAFFNFYILICIGGNLLEFFSNTVLTIAIFLFSLRLIISLFLYSSVFNVLDIIFVIFLILVFLFKIDFLAWFAIIYLILRIFLSFIQAFKM